MPCRFGIEFIFIFISLSTVFSSVIGYQSLFYFNFFRVSSDLSPKCFFIGNKTVFFFSSATHFPPDILMKIRFVMIFMRAYKISF